jgi:hypothetical protein
MKASGRPPVARRGELRLTIPQQILEVFQANPRVVIKWRPDGLWPIGPELLANPEFLKALAADREFMQNYEVVIMPKG